MLFSGLLWADTEVTHLNAFLDNLGTLQARFEQSVLDQSHNQAARFQGIFYLRRPGQFRWDYQKNVWGQSKNFSNIGCF